MSTDRRSSATSVGRRSDGRRRRRRAFFAGFAVVLGVLALAGGVAAAVGTVQGPRATAVQFDPQAAIDASGSRMILVTSQSLDSVDASQVTVSPETPVTVSTSGRSLGIRFTLPLHDDTDYTVTVRGVTGTGGGPAVTLTQEFRTPPLGIYSLQRTDDGDTVYRSGLPGTDAVAVFSHRHIEDYRATASHLVFSVRTDDDQPELIVTDLDGGGARDLPLPGTGGEVQELQAADRGDVIGYTYTSADPSASDALISALYTASVKDADADAPPTAITSGGAPVSASDWRFVPDTDSLLVLSFEGRLLLTPPDGSDVVDLGDGATIQGIARGSATAIISKPDGIYTVDLADGTSQSLVPISGADGFLGAVIPLPDGETLRQLTTTGDGGGATVYRVDTAGSPTPILTVGGTDALLQTCVSPSGRYAAFLVQPDAATNPYVTGYALPVPRTVETRIVDLETGDQVSSLQAFDISWCQVPLQ